MVWGSFKRLSLFEFSILLARTKLVISKIIGVKWRSWLFMRVCSFLFETGSKAALIIGFCGRLLPHQIL